MPIGSTNAALKRTRQFVDGNRRRARRPGFDDGLRTGAHGAENRTAAIDPA